MGQKLRNPKNTRKTIRQAHSKCKPPLQKTPNLREMRAFRKLPKMATMQTLQPMQNPQFGSKIKNAKKVRDTILRPHQSCCVQKTAPKNSQYSKNGSIFKIAKNGHNAKAIAHAKWSVWVNNYNCLKDAKNVSTNTLKLFYAKNGSKKQLIFEK